MLDKMKHGLLVRMIAWYRLDQKFWRTSETMLTSPVYWLLINIETAIRFYYTTCFSCAVVILEKI